MRAAARADRVGGAEPRRSDRSCETRRGAGRDRGRHGDGPGDPGPGRPPGEIWFRPDSRGLSARELIRLAQAVRLRPRPD